MKGLSFFNKLIFLVNSLSLLLLLLSYVSPYVNPNIFWPISFLGLLFPILFIINFFFLTYWFVRMKRQVWANIIILLIGVQYINAYIGTHPKKETSSPTIKILSYNVRIFNAYKWIPELKKETIFNYLRKETVDILCLQEFYAPDTIPDLNYTHQHIGAQSKKSQLHMAIYSRYEQKKRGTVSIYGERMNNTCIFSDIIIDNDTFKEHSIVRVYNIHLASNWFDNSNYDFIINPAMNKEAIKEGILDIANRLKNSFKKRAIEVDAIKKHMNKSPYPIIVCGDFNDTPVSYAYQNIKGDLLDSFSTCAKGIGSSFVKIPGLRIDYILHDKIFKSVNYQKQNEVLSDHYPISCEIKIQ